MESNNKFSLDYYRRLIVSAQEAGYDFYTVGSFIRKGCPKKKSFVLRHDLDAKPTSLVQLLDVEKSCGVKSSVYVRVTANDYNIFDYMNVPILIGAERAGNEVGLHTNFYEYAIINGLDPMRVLKFETEALRSFVSNVSLAPHRDFQYAYNSLPWLEENWDVVSRELKYEFHAYDERVTESTTYVNEGYTPHLSWRIHTPENVIASGHSVYMMTHPHFWWSVHPFEHGV